MSEVDEDRIESVIRLITALASGDLSARGQRSAADDEIDAVLEGVNMLAEELEASRVELEDRVRERTAQLEEANRDILRLGELGNLLQACETAEEAYVVSQQGLAAMFEGLSGGIYFYRSSRNLLELKVTWADPPVADMMSPTECWALRRGHAHFVDSAVPSLSCAHVTGRSGNSLCVPMSAHGQTIGVLHLMTPRPDATATSVLTPAKRRLAQAAGEQTSLAMANLSLREKLQMQALRDPLTGLYNRRFVDDWIAQEGTLTERHGRSLGVIMADVDHFKQINDVHGHDAGDALLRRIADALRAALRPGDLPCRYGGEEFLVLLSDIDLDTLRVRAEALCAQVSAMQVVYRGAMLPTVSLSAGIAVYPRHGATPTEVVRAADAAMYDAKRSGRNRTVTAA